MILAGDVGGTKTELAIYENKDGMLDKLESEKFISNEYSGLEEIISLFLSNREYQIDSACIGIPGPVENGKVKLTNLSWELDETDLSEKLNIRKFKLANDLEAIATAVPFIENDDLIMICKGSGDFSKSNKAILAPGTGLGQAALVYRDNEYTVIPTEGGHTDFAPCNEIERELLKYLQNKYEHVSYERVISGIGLVNIFEYLKSTGKFEISNELMKRIETGDSAAVISAEGVSRNSEICVKAIDIFVSILGAQAGNMVLNFKATGGVYLGGGIPVKITDKLKEGLFLKAFLNKGRLSYLTEMTPVFIIKNESAGSFGAAIIANRL
jgi:glucokinase